MNTQTINEVNKIYKENWLITIYRVNVLKYKSIKCIIICI